MNTTDPASTSPPPKPRRWPVALLVSLITAIASAALVIPVADWAMEALNVSNFEGGRGFGIIFLWVPLALLVGFVVGFGVSFPTRRTGFGGYAVRQSLAVLIMAALISGIAGLVYATVDHPPLIEGKNLALEMQVRVPTKGRSVEELKAAGFSIALVVSASDRSYSDMRWDKAVRTDEFIAVPAWGRLNSSNAGREITAGVESENRQVFSVLLTASPKKIEDAWSEWTPPRQRFDGSKASEEEQYFARYRVRFAEEYSPMPSPTPQEGATPNEDEVIAKEKE